MDFRDFYVSKQQFLPCNLPEIICSNATKYHKDREQTITVNVDFRDHQSKYSGEHKIFCDTVDKVNVFRCWNMDHLHYSLSHSLTKLERCSPLCVVQYWFGPRSDRKDHIWCYLHCTLAIDYKYIRTYNYRNQIEIEIDLMRKRRAIVFSKMFEFIRNEFKPRRKYTWINEIKMFILMKRTQFSHKEKKKVAALIYCKLNEMSWDETIWKIVSY